jgi:hypothetical protein
VISRPATSAASSVASSGARIRSPVLSNEGLFARQLARHGSDHAGRKSLRLLYLSLPIIAVALVVIVIAAYGISLIR